ncbi:MAG TPA: DNA polymerase III subunit epsilon, partial [Demequina sp.]|nr:DNA polymerase III subunit epsilon [Demequina sp.]
MSWIDGPMLGFDTETTGVSTANDRIVTAAAILRHGAEVQVR